MDTGGAGQPAPEEEGLRYLNGFGARGRPSRTRKLPPPTPPTPDNPPAGRAKLAGGRWRPDTTRHPEIPPPPSNEPRTLPLTTRPPTARSAGNHFESEARPGTLPARGNNPRRCPHGLYAEQLSGTAFTAPRHQNQRSWLYRIKPSVTHEPFHPVQFPNEALKADFSSDVISPNQIRWQPFEVPRHPVDFVRGLFTVAGHGNAGAKQGFAIHVYGCNRSMDDSCLANADGDLLLVPQMGRLLVTTEFGKLHVPPGEVCVVQRGMRFSVALLDGDSRGYVLEVFGGHFALPELGVIGANGNANPQDFQSPTAAFDAELRPGFRVIHKLEGHLFSAQQDFSPFNVVAWRGNYVPFKYDLSKFCPMNAVAFDHPDPSIFTVLTCPSGVPGCPVADFVVFPPRWSVSEETFRPPYYHRNCMSEFMGLIRGEYEGKVVQEGSDGKGFRPGGASLHSCMTPHGPDADTYERATGAEAGPHKLDESTLAFMFETDAMPRVTSLAMASQGVERDYYKCWTGLKSAWRDPAEMKGGGAAGGPP